MFLLGLIAGLGLWQSFQLVTIIPAAIMWLVVRRRDVIRLLPATVLGARRRASYRSSSRTFAHDWWSRNIGTPGDAVPYWERVGRFFTNALPLALDLRAPVTLHWLLWKPFGLVLYAVVLTGFAVARLVASTADEATAVSSSCSSMASIFPFIYAFSPLTTFRFHAGYVVVLMPVLALLLCAWIRTERQAMIMSRLAVVLMATRPSASRSPTGTRRTAYPFSRLRRPRRRCPATSGR